MPATNPATKVECVNPNTDGRMNIDAAIYALFSKVIYHTLKKDGELTFTQMVEGVRGCFQEQKTTFDGSVEWYTVSVKNDMQSKGIIDVFTHKGRKLYKLVKVK